MISALFLMPRSPGVPRVAQVVVSSHCGGAIMMLKAHDGRDAECLAGGAGHLFDTANEASGYHRRYLPCCRIEAHSRRARRGDAHRRFAAAMMAFRVAGGHEYRWRPLLDIEQGRAPRPRCRMLELLGPVYVADACLMRCLAASRQPGRLDCSPSAAGWACFMRGAARARRAMSASVSRLGAIPRSHDKARFCQARRRPGSYYGQEMPPAFSAHSGRR